MDYITVFYTKNKEHAIPKKRISLLIIILSLFLSSKPMDLSAQCPDEVCFYLESLIFPANLWRVEDILNIRMENMTSDNLNIYLVGTITEEFIGELITVRCSEFLLKPGIPDYISPADYEPVYVNYNTDFSDYVQEIAVLTGSLPAGVYTICVTAYKNNGDVCGNNCIVQEVAHPSPPELIYPSNESFVTEDLPVFSWLPPMPSSGQVKYTIEIVEILDGQVPVEAIESNFRWFRETVDNVTTLQYPVSARAFNTGAHYAWTVEAFMGPEIPGKDVNPRIISPVWSFTFLGTKKIEFNEQYLINQVSPGNNEVLTTPPFFEWELTNPSSQRAETRVLDQDIYYEVKIWEWPDSLDAGDAGSFSANLGSDPSIEPFFEVNKLETGYFNIAESDPGILKMNNTYFWKVFSIKDEMIIAESELRQFSILADNGFTEAAESMLNAVELGEESEIYGVTKMLLPGGHIEPEDRSDKDSIDITRESFLFIIDDEPYSRYGHPVQYVVVDNETREVTVYDANWFPEVKNSEEPAKWQATGVVNLKGEDITMLSPRGEQETESRPRITADISEVKLEIDCGNYVIILDGGDKDRTGTTDNIASQGARDADSMQALYEKKHYKVERFSQYFDNKNQAVKSLPVDPVAKTGARFLKDLFSEIKEHYVSMECCTASKLNFELVIYINANAIPASSKFKIYKPDGSGVCENIDYFEDVLKYLQTLPQCVKITLFVDACFSGVVVDAIKLDSYLKRGNYEIRTAADALHTTPSGVAKSHPVHKTPVSPKPAATASRGTEASFTEITLALEKLKEMNGKQEANINLGESYASVNESVKSQSKDLNRTYPNPQFSSIHPRAEFYLQFPALQNTSTIKECKVLPANSANLILNKMNGTVTLFSKIEGEIKVIMTYENGSEEIKPITSGWGDDT